MISLCRKRGRPTKRWFDEVEKDLETLGVRNWRRRARDRGLWRKIVGEAMVQHGL